MSDDELARLREQVRALDKELVGLTARRLALARRIGELKRDMGQPIRNYAVEADALRVVRDAAAALGVNPAAAEELLKIEIRESLRAQEKDRVGRRARTPGTRGRALVIGGAGNMGAWFCEFLESLGHEVHVADPRGAQGRPHVRDPAAEAAHYDLLLVATPPSVTPTVLKSLHGRTRGLILDIASLKAPHAAELRELAAGGAKVASVHPMWGPKADLLAGRNVVVCDCGHPDAAREARALFEDTAATIVEMPLEEHDRFMGLVLGLPHAVSLAFGHALSAHGTPFREVASLGGPTFQKQVAVSREVASENKDLYFEIQRLNPHTARVLEGLRRSLDDLEAAVADRERFRAYMARAERWFGGDDA